MRSPIGYRGIKAKFWEGNITMRTERQQFQVSGGTAASAERLLGSYCNTQVPKPFSRSAMALQLQESLHRG